MVLNFLCLLLILPMLTLTQDCSPTWLQNRENHKPTDLTSDPESLLYFAETLQDEADFERHLDAILIPRNVGTENHGIVEDYISGTLESLGWTVELDTFSQDTVKGNKSFTNIMGHVNPCSPRRVVIACHYDTYTAIEGFVGAIDSAVPCAMLLNLATKMKDDIFALNYENPELSVTLMFFDGEEALDYWTSEDSVYGSTHIAETWLTTDYRVDENSGFCQTENATYMDRMDLLFLYDLIGTPEPDFQRFLRYDNRDFYTMMDDVEEVLGGIAPLDVMPMFNGLNTTSTVSDDQSPFYARGMDRIFYLITRPFPSVWHKAEDNKDCLDFEYIKRLNQLLRIWLAEYLQYQRN